MDYKRVFEDEGFIYELTVKPTADASLQHQASKEELYRCAWAITGKETHLTREVNVTDDECEVIYYHSVEAAVRGAKEFLNI